MSLGAIGVGIAVGFISFLPLFGSMRLARKHPSTSVMNTALYGLGGVCTSLVLAALALIICALTARSSILFFGLAEIIVLVGSTVIYVWRKNASVSPK